MAGEWFRDPEAVEMRRDIERALQIANRATSALELAEQIQAERFKALILGQKVLFCAIFVIGLISLLGPHDGILSAFHTIVKS